jgi:branched-subunit amino acid aminotransferase/4-amino-4-deoxychorismate lyase
MPETTFICLNGEFVSSHQPSLYIQNRAFRYGDGVFESMRAIGTSVPFFKWHIERLRKGVAFMEMELPDNFTNSYIEKQITRLLNANKHFNGARIRFGVFRKDGGNFSPTTNKTEYYIESIPTSTNNFQLNIKGLVIDIYSDYTKPINNFNQLKSINSQLYIKASLNAQSRNLDDCLILNEHKRIIEATSSNIFIFSNNNLITPSITEGCLPGIMREIIIQLALKEKVTVYDDVFLNEKDLTDADEIFLTNAITGIKWVVAFKNRRYFSKLAKKLSYALNEYAKTTSS